MAFGKDKLVFRLEYVVMKVKNDIERRKITADMADFALEMHREQAHSRFAKKFRKDFQLNGSHFAGGVLFFRSNGPHVTPAGPEE